ncbi:MAG: hypothetical protein QOK40_3269 [Miltoncostaeaceae bacterium]|jgi:hypothetical protein|nr:hypothetical protein [Miltoncostaeaceae bacterium]
MARRKLKASVAAVAAALAVAVPAAGASAATTAPTADATHISWLGNPYHSYPTWGWGHRVDPYPTWGLDRPEGGPLLGLNLFANLFI